MSKLIIDRLSPVISSVSKDRILDSVRHKVGESISNTLVRDLNENLVRDISRSLLMSLTNTLTRSVTHSVVPTIAMATSYDVKTDLSCRKCFETSQSVFCEACPYVDDWNCIYHSRMPSSSDQQTIFKTQQHTDTPQKHRTIMDTTVHITAIGTQTTMQITMLRLYVT